MNVTGGRAVELGTRHVWNEGSETAAHGMAHLQVDDLPAPAARPTGTEERHG